MNLLKKVINKIQDIIFPIECLGCGAQGKWICNSCLNKINNFSYNNKLLKKAIHTYKYKFVRNLAEPLGKLMVQRITQDNKYNIQDIDCIVPIPLYKKRLKWRGFNQTELLANEISKHINKPMINALSKIKNTKPQIQFNEKSRKKNVKNVFVCTVPEIITNKNILLIDDVKTTGATLNEAKKILLKAKAKSVFTLTLAKT